MLTGAVFRDTNANGKYELGEGLAGVTLRAAGARAVQTFVGGGYTVTLPRRGVFTVTASGGGLAAPLTRTVFVRANSNARLNLVAP